MGDIPLHMIITLLVFEFLFAFLLGVYAGVYTLKTLLIKKIADLTECGNILTPSVKKEIPAVQLERLMGWRK